MNQELKQDVLLLVIAVFAALVLGAVVFSFTEGWSLINSFYFATMTATTVGYGDFTPQTLAGKLFTILFSLSIIPFVLYTFSVVAKAQMDGVYKKLHHLEKQQKVQEEEIDEAEKKLKEQKAEIMKQDEELEKVEEVEDILVEDAFKSSGQ